MWRARSGVPLALPTHFTVRLAEAGSDDLVADVEAREFRAFAEAISRVERRFECIVVDTPGSNSYLMRVSHAMADTLITPINESLVDFDVLARVDPDTYAMQGPSHYAELMAEARRQRGLIDVLRLPTRARPVTVEPDDGDSAAPDRDTADPAASDPRRPGPH